LKKRFYSLYLIFLFLFLLFPPACNNPHSPKLPETPEKVEYYDYQLTYKRTTINMPDEMDPLSCFLHVKDGVQIREIQLTKINEYEFVGQIENLPTNLENDTVPSNWIYTVDPKRWVKKWALVTGQEWGKPHSVGDIFILRNVQTGVTKQLMKIVANYHLEAPPECEAQEAQFKQRKGGIIVDE